MQDSLSEPSRPDPHDLPVGRIDVWVIALEEIGEAPAPEPADWLSPDERARRDRFAFEGDRRRFVLGRGAMRGILAGYLRCAPQKIAFAYGDAGKPRLDNPELALDLQFNASGSGDLAVCAITCGRSLGIDIEVVREDCDPDLVRFALTDVERAEFEQISDMEQPSAFYRTWTRKEAYLKAMGCGLSRPLTSFAVSVKPGIAPCLVRDDLAPLLSAKWSFADVDPAPGWVGTLVCSGDPRPVRRLVWSGC